MSGTVQLNPVDFQNVSVFGNEFTQRICFTSNEIWDVYNQSFANSLQLGRICLVVGFIIGALSVYIYMSRKYGST